MNLKTLYSLTGVLAILAAITYFVKNSDSSLPADPRVGQPLLETEQLKDVTKIQLLGDEQTITLQADPDNSTWRLTEKHDLPANMSTLGDTVSSLAEASIERLVSARPERIAELGFAGDRIILSNATGDEIANIEIGRETDAGKQIIRFGEEQKAFLVDSPIAMDGDPLQWLDKKLIGYERNDVRSVAIAWQDGATLSAAREDAEAEWTAETELPEGKILAKNPVDSLAGRFTNLSFSDLATLDDPAVVAASENSHTVRIGLEGGKTYEIRIGRRPEVSVEKEFEIEGEDGEPATETRSEVETPAGPVYVFIESSDSEDPINGYMAITAFEVSSFNYTSLPETIDALLEDAPEEERSAEL